MVLLPLLNRASCRCTAILGTVKNAGKTVTLNRLVAEAALAGLKIGITSSGRDGERYDAVYGHQKPAIRLPAGTLVLTYDGFAGEALPLLSPLGVLDRRPGFGSLVVARMEKAAEIQIAGPVTRSTLNAGLDRLRREGAGLVLVDGSIDRRGFIDPGNIDSLILATGMALSPDLEEVAEKTAFFVEILKLPVWQEGLPPNNAYRLGGRWVDSGMDSALGDEVRLAHAIPEGCSAVYLKGALTDRLLQALIKRRKYISIVLENPYACFAGRRAYYSYLLRGGEIKVRCRSELLAVTVNPWGHNGFTDPEVLVEAVKKAVPGLPVIDVQKELIL